MEIQMREGLYTLQKIGVSAKEAGQDQLAATAEQNMNKYYELYVNKVYKPE